MSLLFLFLSGGKLYAQFSSEAVHPEKYLATMLFGGTCAGACPEPNFPQRIDFNTTQDANGDSVVNAEDAMENLIRYSIGDSLVDTGRTGLPGRGPNDQRPAVYFHHIEQGGFDIYQYWHYYADNDWVNNHEHDVQYYFVYEQCGVPLFILLSYHNFTNMFKWGDIPKDDGHPLFGVEAGSHGYQNDSSHNGVRIRYDGMIHERNGKLTTPDSVQIPWLIFSNDSMVEGASSYPFQPDTMFKGDPTYPFPNPCEYCDGRASPWLRTAWDSVQMPNTSNCPDPVADFEGFVSGKSVVFLDSTENASQAFWNYGDGEKDTGFYPTHTYDSAGSYEVCLSVVDSCREDADCLCRTVTVGDTANSLDGWRGKASPLVKIGPNPARSHVDLRTAGVGKELGSVRIRSLRGRPLGHIRPEPIGKGKYRLSLQGLPEGILFLEIGVGARRTVKKVVKRSGR